MRLSREYAIFAVQQTDQRAHVTAICRTLLHALANAHCRVGMRRAVTLV